MVRSPLLLVLALAGPVAAQPRADAEGDLLPDGAVARFGSVRYRLGPVAAVALSPDGKTLAAESQLAVTLWDVGTGRPGLRIPVTGSYERVPLRGPLIFTADGRYLVRVAGKHVRVYDAATCRERLWRGLGENGFRLSPVPGTSRFAVNEGDQTARVFDAADGRTVSVVQSDSAVYQLTPSGRSFLGWHKGCCVLVDADTGKVRVAFPNTHQFGLPEFAVSPDDRRLYGVGPQGRLHTYDTATGTKLSALDPPPGWPESDGRKVGLALSPDGTVAYLWRVREVIQRRDLAAGRWLPPLPAVPEGRLLPHPDGKRVLFAGADGVLRRFDLATAREIHPPDGFDEDVAVSPCPDGRLVAVTSGGRVDLFDLDGHRRWSARLAGDRARVYWPADGTWLACVGLREITLREPATGRRLRTLSVADIARGDKKSAPFKYFGESVALSQAGDRMAVSLASDSLHSEAAVFDPWSAKPAQLFDLGEGGQVTLSPDGRELALSSAGRCVRFLDLATGRTTRAPDDAHPRDPGPVATWDTQYNPDGSYLLSWDGGGRAVLRDGGTGRLVRTIDVDQETVPGFAFSPDGLWLATGGADGRLALWDTRTGARVWARAGHANAITNVGFAGPRRLVSGARDLTALVWDLRPDGKMARPAWEALAGRDARAAYRAIWALADDPTGPTLLRARLPPAEPVPAGQLAQWVGDLGSPRFAAREAATAELRKFGRLVEPDLRATRDRATDAEVRTRLDKLLSELTRERTWDEVIRARAVAAMELAGTAEARRLLAEWAAGAPAARLTKDAKAALARLAPGR